MTILQDPAYTVPPAAPAGPVGTLAWLRAAVPRFCDGPDHARRRALVIARLAEIDPAGLRARADETGDHVVALAQALGAIDAQAAAGAVREIAPHYNPPPGTGTSPAAADAAVARLLSLLPAAEPEVAAQDICILVQGCAATAALLAQRGALEPPPVPVTRRIAPDGSLVEVDLAAHPFGAGPHACPAAVHALALVP